MVTTQEILEIVDDAFENNVEANGWLDFGTPMADLTGRGEMLAEIERKLTEMNGGE